MLELYMIRHGFADEPLEDEKMDEERPLKKKGKEQIQDVSKGLKAQKTRFDVVFSSPLLRAKETAEIVNEFCGKSQEVEITDLLRPESSYNALIKFLNTFKSNKTVAIVGHEPFLSGFASYCLSKSKRSLIHLKKGGVLMLEIDEVIKPGHCLLSWLMEPTQIIQK